MISEQEIPSSEDTNAPVGEGTNYRVGFILISPFENDLQRQQGICLNVLVTDYFSVACHYQRNYPTTLVDQEETRQ